MKRDIKFAQFAESILLSKKEISNKLCLLYTSKMCIRDRPWIVCGSEVILLEGKSGGFATEFLEKVE